METRERIKLHRILKCLGVIVAVLLGGALYLGASTARYMKGIIRDQFNRQQMVLARATALMVEESIQNSISDVNHLGTVPAIQYCDPKANETLLRHIWPLLNRDNIVEIGRVGVEGRPLLVVNEHGVVTTAVEPVHREEETFLEWASDARNRGQVMATKVYRRGMGNSNGLWVLDLVVPLYEDSTDDLHPRPSQRFTGYLRATLDVGRLLRQIFQPITSGNTGYAWVIDSFGNFLYHPEDLVIGENAFTIRHSHNPDVPLARINEQQRREMLEGREGTGTYIAGWHRKVVEPVEKIIAYTPVWLQGAHVPHAWSVAVVTPVREVDGLINSVYGKQALLQSLVVFVILFSSLTVLLYELRWSRILEQEVAVKTDDIRRYNDKLERSEAKYRTLVETAEDFIFTLKPDGRIETANRHMATTFRMGSRSPSEQSLDHFLPPQIVDDQLKILNEVLQSRQSRKTEIMTVMGSSEIWLDCRYIPLNSERDGDERILCVARDISERKQMEAQLINSEKLASLGTLAAGIAHEMNNPLGVILGFCELLLEKVKPGTIEYEDLKTIERNGLHCKETVDRLLSFAMTEEDPAEACDINSSIESVLSEVQEYLSENNIEVVCTLAKGLPLVVGNSKDLREVFLNILRNAIGAMDGEKGGVLSLATKLESSGKQVGVYVSDTGPGIRKTCIRRVFDPFYTTRNVGEGMGLGLSVSFGIVSRCGGTIRCESEAEEDGADTSGTTFVISLPVQNVVLES